MEITEVKGIGPATAIKLKGAGINTAEQLVEATVESLVDAGITSNTAAKLISAAKDAISKGSVTTISGKPAASSKPKKDEKDIKSIKIPVAYVKGVGPKTRDVLEEGGLYSAQDLANATEDQLVNLGIPAGTASKIIANATEQINELPEEAAAAKSKAKAEPKVEEPVKEVKAKEPAPVEEKKLEPEKPKAEPKKAEKPKKAKEAPSTEAERSPMPQGIPTKKKRGVQIRRADDVELSAPVEKKEGWSVQARQLSPEEIEKRKIRQEEMARSKSIQREAPLIITPVKAVKSGKQAKTEKPVKAVKSAKKVKTQKKTQKTVVEYYSQADLFSGRGEYRIRSLAPAAGESKPRISLDRDTTLGRISSFRRSRRIVNQRQLIVNLNEEFASEQVVGQKIYFKYPETNEKIPGSISRRFGKQTSKKVIASFSKGIRTEAINQTIFIK